MVALAVPEAEEPMTNRRRVRFLPMAVADPVAAGGLDLEDAATDRRAAGQARIAVQMSESGRLEENEKTRASTPDI